MLPNDPIMLFSFVNTQLRDNYSSLDAMCLAFCVKKKDIINKLALAGYEYDADTNRFQAR